MRAACVALTALLISACAPGADGGLAIAAGQVRETLPGRNVSVGYLTITNGGSEPCELIGVSSPGIPTIQVHEHRHTDGKMQMREVVKLIVPAGSEVIFRSGGHHLMLLDLPAALRRGETVAFSFDFGTCGTLEERFPVVGAGE